MVKVKSKAKKGQRPKHLGLRSKEMAIKKILNPFEVHVNRQKHDVLGRKGKNDRGLPGVARAKAMKKRKATLLQEYRVQDKSNKFLDRRIGEKNRAMTGEDRIMARFTAERMKIHNKKTIFNLADDEILTHHGQTLNEIEKFDDPRSDDEDERDEGKLDSSFVKDAHFGGGILSKSGNPQSRKELIDQLIAESKKRKAEQKKSREQTQELTDKLDTEWKDLLPIISTSKKKPGVDDMGVDKPDAYDTMIRELKFEARGKATDRLKSEEEIAMEEKERLEKLEADRLRRMKGITDSDEPKPTHRSADDMDDGFEIEALEDVNTVSYDADGNLEQSSLLEDEVDEDMETDDKKGKGGGSASDESSSDSGDDDEDEGEEEDDDDDLEDLKSDSDSDSTPAVNNTDKQMSKSQGTTQCSEMSEKKSTVLSGTGEKRNLSEGDGTIEKNSPTHKANMRAGVVKEVLDSNIAVEVQMNRDELIKKDLKERQLMMQKARKELPYTYKAPENYEELQDLLSNQSPEYQSVIMERIIKCTHPSLASGNKDKLATLLAFMLQHLHDVASQENGADCFIVLDHLAPHLYDIAIVAPGNTRRCVAEVLKEKQSDYQQQRHKFPQLDTLVFLKLVSLLFPTSDYRHPVVTPAFVFMGQMLSKCRVKTRRDVATGLFIATLSLEYTVLSKRFCPAVINFLFSLLRSAMPSSKNADHLLKISSNFTLSGDLGLLNLTELSSKQSIDASFKCQVVFHVLRLLQEFYTHLNDLPSSIQLFMPILSLRPKSLPTTLCKRVEELQHTVRELQSRNMPKLIPESKKPKLLRLYEPNIEEVYDGKKFKVMGRERQEREKLIHKVKRETKGALREIRRDRTFIAKLKINETMRSDAERRAKVKDIFGSAAIQQGELRALERKKKN